MGRPIVVVLASCAALCGIGPTASAQSSFSSPVPRPWGQISFYTNTSRSDAGTGPTRSFNELTTAFSYHLPETDTSGPEYGIDVRRSTYTLNARPTRVSLYEGFVGGRFAGGAAVARIGHVWLSDLGSLGSVAGGQFEYRQRRASPEDGRFRGGVFGGLEPNVLDAGYADHVTKFGGYMAYDGRGLRRHSGGYVVVKNRSVTERAVVSMTNYVPAGSKVFIYQAAEYDVQRPAGQASRGLSYLFATARVLVNERFDLQGTYNRGRSIDARTLAEDFINARAVPAAALDGLLFESAGARVTFEAAPRVRVYVGYGRDKNSRDADPTNRTLVGGYASNILRSGVDLSASDSRLNRPGGSYHSSYVSIGHQIGRQVYVSGDYSTSLSLIRFSRSDGIVVETRPHTTRLSATVTSNIGRSFSLMATAEQTRDGEVRDLRILSGLSYRLR